MLFLSLLLLFFNKGFRTGDVALVDSLPSMPETLWVQAPAPHKAVIAEPRRWREGGSRVLVILGFRVSLKPG